MKKLFTLVALLAMFMGAKAEWVEDYSIDYSTKSNFPFYVMGYVPEWIDGVMTDFGSNYRYETQANLDGDGDSKWKDGEESVGTAMAGNTEYQKVTGAGPYWHQYFIADGIPTELDGSYTVTAMVKASEEVTINVNMGWNWSGGTVGASVTIPTEWTEVEWEYSGIGGEKCNLVAQPGTSAVTIEWKWVKVSHNAKGGAAVNWIEQLKNGDASEDWPAWALEKTDGVNINWRGDRTGEICAWALTMGRNFDEYMLGDNIGRARPYPADIEPEEGNESNRVFVVHADQCDVIDSDENSWQWANQFWIQSPKAWKNGTKVKIHFRYKASQNTTVATQIHKQWPSDYLFYSAVGDLNFTTEWQEFDNTYTFTSDSDNGWSLAFNLNNTDKDPMVFYFDDLSWQIMDLDEGYFAAGCNTATGLEYDFANAVEFVDEDGLLVATLGEEGKPETYVSQIMISTVRGDDSAFKSNTLKPTGTIENDPENWMDYEPSSLAKLTLPGAGVWTIYLDTEYKSMAFEMIEGTVIEKPEINPNPTVITIEAAERESQDWDNQFWIVANDVIDGDTETVLEFDYSASQEAKVTTQTHGEPSAYKGGATEDLTFTTEEQHYKGTVTIPSKDWQGNAITGVKSIAFNLACIQDACVYTIKNVVWKLADGTKSLIDQTGTKPFWVKILGVNTTTEVADDGTETVKSNPYQYGTDPSGITSVVKNNTGSAVIFNLAGQRVSNDYKGIVVKEGKKVMVK